jgi:deazaflavin-dependent oxidoreductase (nitroreductase family)
MANQPGPIGRRLLRAPGLLYDWHAGWLLGHRFLRLTHLGRRSGRRYRTMLEVVGTGQAPGEVVVVAGLGRSADWFRNLQAGRGVEVAIGRRRFRPGTGSSGRGRRRPCWPTTSGATGGSRPWSAGC